jgi:probable phosphoglycerate mutase
MRRTLLVTRHGETDWNVAQRWQGQSDIPLNDNGRAQAYALAERLRGYDLCGIVSSDLSRAKETAEIVARLRGIERIEVDIDLRERCFGCFEGLTRQECETTLAQAWHSWLHDRTPPLGGESTEALADRAYAALGRAAREIARDDTPALVVTHGGVMRAVVARATGQHPQPIQNTELWRVVWDEAVLLVERLSSPSK